MKNGKAAVIEDIYKDDRVPAEAYKPTFVKSLAVVPIRTIEPIGAIGNYWATIYSPSSEEIQMLQALADLTSVALENVRAYGELEHRVFERTAQLEEKNKDLEALSYSLSHDLRAPLRFISLYTNTLQKEHLANASNEAAALSEKILKKTEVMNELIEGLLKFFTATKENVRGSIVSMQALATEICKDLKEENNGREIEMTIQTLPDAFGDHSLLKQVWTNLISNAVKYSSKLEKPVIEIGSIDENEGTTFFVKDNGAGFDSTYKEKLFKVLERLHTYREFEGTGFGLAIVERIITKHGGRVWAEGETNKGATFYFYLPSKKAEANFLAEKHLNVF